ncbi:hypothetical protein [Caulobacter sp. RHG1]|uniref:hypothetical protein n=1 Tax=Caulobacter sp. (strain RHG1) TaxID=2545762 RepID=UPI001553C586|nr:hypothetical protein [Caulobacter sp. RHG1]
MRDRFAMAALTGLLANSLAEPRYSGNLIYAAEEAYRIADEMLVQRAALSNGEHSRGGV